MLLIGLLCLIPFCGKAFHIDDPLFVWTAKHIQQTPLDFYGFSVLWETTELPMSQVTQNPPLATYYLAAAASVLGWEEVPLHLAFLLPALAAISGMYVLATRFCSRPVLAVLAAVLTPAFLVSSTTVMCDTMMLAFWVWAIVCWDSGLLSQSRTRSLLLLAVAGVLIGLASLTKYFGMSLLPLLAVYGFTRLREAKVERGGAKEESSGAGIQSSFIFPLSSLRWLATLLIPLAMLAGYQLTTQAMYGRGLLLSAAGYAQETRHFLRVEGVWKWLIAIEFTGGCVASAGFFFPWLWRPRTVLIGVALLIPLALGLSEVRPQHLIPYAPADETAFSGSVVAHMTLFMACGVIVVALAACDFYTRRDAGSLLLALWVVGTLLFAAQFNWSINGRTILPMVPAVGILVARRLEQRVKDEGGRMKDEKRELSPAPVHPSPSTLHPPPVTLHPSPFLALLPAAAVALAATWGDYSLANAAREAARDIGTDPAVTGRGVPLWFQGHWGFQLYMEQFGARPVDIEHPKLQPSDLLILPSNNSSVIGPPPGMHWDDVKWSKPSSCLWVTTMHREAKAGFYADYMGPLPFAFGEVPPEEYRVIQLRLPKKTAKEER